MGKKTLVFVDDSETVLMAAEMSIKPLVDKGLVELQTFKDPLELLDAVDRGLVYDLLITDVNMPQMNGLEMAQRLKSNPNVKLKPILALTTETSPQKKMIAKKIGLTGWVTKPFTPEKLLMAVKRVLRIR